MRYYIIAGEASGDLHGSNLVKEIKKLDPNSKFRCWGGDLLKEQSDNLVKHYKNYSYRLLRRFISQMQPGATPLTCTEAVLEEALARTNDRCHSLFRGLS